MFFFQHRVFHPWIVAFFLFLLGRADIAGLHSILFSGSFLSVGFWILDLQLLRLAVSKKQEAGPPALSVSAQMYVP